MALKEHIHTIPIYDAFRLGTGCPLCALRSGVEERKLESLLDGECTMDPGVREKTDEAGFCREHLFKLKEMGDALSLALLLESRLLRLEKDLFGGPASSGPCRPVKETLDRSLSSCYICHEIDETMRLYCGIIIDLWRKDESFRELFLSQPRFCLRHDRDLVAQAEKKLKKNEAALFLSCVSQVRKNCLERLKVDARAFCKSFDYRYAGRDLGEAKTIVRRTIAFLTGDGEKR